MFRSTDSDSRPVKRASRFSPKPSQSEYNVERNFTSGNLFTSEELANNGRGRLPQSTLEGLKVLWRQSRMSQGLHVKPVINRDGQMPAEELSETSDSSDHSSSTMFDRHQRRIKPKKRLKVYPLPKSVEERVLNVTDLTASQEMKELNKPRRGKDFSDVAVQAMRPATIDPLVEGRLNMLESRLRLEEMRSKSWCVRMTEAEDNVKNLQAQVKTLNACLNGPSGQQKFVSPTSKEQGVRANSSEEKRKTQRPGRVSHLCDKDFTSEFNAILQQIRKDNESEEMVGDFRFEAKKM